MEDRRQNRSPAARSVALFLSLQLYMLVTHEFIFHIFKFSTFYICYKGKLVVLVNQQSASASEIVSGAIQDWDRGVIVGRRTFGKGLVQKPMSLTDGSKIRLTTQRYFTPSGRCIQKSYEDGSKEYRKESRTRYQNGELYSADSIKTPDSLIFKTLVLIKTLSSK